MLLAMKDCVQNLSGSDLDILEGKLKVSLPVEFRVFLLKYNGGEPERVEKQKGQTVAY